MEGVLFMIIGTANDCEFISGFLNFSYDNSIMDLYRRDFMFSDLNFTGWCDG